GPCPARWRRVTQDLSLALLIGALVLLVAVWALRLSQRLGLPVLLIYLALGVAVGEAGLGVQFEDSEIARVLGLAGLMITFAEAGLGVQFEDYEIARVLGLAALMIIIAEGGLTMRWSTLRSVVGSTVALSTLGVVITIAVAGVALHLLLGLDLRLALLYGAVLSSTDAAAVFATLRRLRLLPRTAATLEAESASNDPAAVIAVLLLSVGPEEIVWWRDGLMVVYQLVGGGVVGALVALVGIVVLRRVALPSAGLYPLAVVGFAVLAFAVGSMVATSGFVAVYVAGVILGNARLPHHQAIMGFAEGLAWIAQISLFVLLGLLVSPSELPSAIGVAMVVGVVLL